MSSICDDLRAAILQAAMQGKLTEQLPEDGTAEELLEQIKVEKEKLITEGKIKKQKPLAPITEAEMPFEIPKNWKWVRHNDIFEIFGGSQPPKDKFSKEKKSGYVRLYQIRDYGDHPVPVYVPMKSVTKFTIKGDILLARYGGSLGKVFLAEEGAYNVAMAKVCKLFENDNIDADYLFNFYLSPIYQNMIKTQANSRSAQGGFNKNDLDTLLFPLPPLTEQKRIVEKIDELMARVADLEKSADALASLKKSFPDDIKASLLQAAMQGKLTKQLPEDDSAEDLLKEIKAEKEKLITEGKIKKQKPLAPITDDEIPFNIPENWKWVRLNDILDVRDGTHDSPKYVKADVGVPLVTSKNLRNGSIDYSDVKYISIADSEAINQRSKVDINDILMAMIGTIGNPVKVVEEPHYSIKNMALLKHLPENMPNMDYILQVLNWAVSDMKEKSSGGVQKFVSLNFIREYPIPLPPLAEQRRIVEHLDSLMQNINVVGELIASE